ncbi:DUF4811 domain-containing protein [Lacticaseibacillus salsurivasis]|uniref:DUF4811 domain-containing protein n=1 Tax=Lacticaseibacillus salsurivasis TaxID=3081441 RepID=UPI0030C6F81E
MILVILVLAAFCFFLVAVLAPRGRARSGWMGALALILIASVLAIAANDLSHFGLKTVTTSATQRIAGVKANTLLVKPIGTNGKNQVVVYRPNPLSSKTVAAKPGVTTTVQVKRGQTATLTIKTKQLRYQNTFFAFLFAWSGQNQQTLHRAYQFTVPASWQLVQQ